jgi:RimJ/RimL family protein N-acetyltransferase
VEYFSTSRLIARDWRTGDLEASFAIYSRVEVARWVFPPPGRPVASLAQMRQMLDRWIARNEDCPDYGMWAVELRATGQVVGAVVLRPLRQDSADVEIGWHLNPDFWGAGYATEAGRGVVALAFGLERVGPDQVGPSLASRQTRPVLDRVQALVNPDNVRSHEVCRRLGMRHLGQADHDGVRLETFELVRAQIS